MQKVLFLLCLLAASAISYAAGNVIRVNNTSDPNAQYAISMLRMALEEINEEYEIEVFTSEITKSRANEEVRIGGQYDLTFSSTSPDIEKMLRPIRIPLFKGLLGHRVFIINADNQHLFNGVDSLEELKEFTVGQGRTWGDTKILEANGFTVIKTSKYPGLFHMVEGGRFDAFPRGVHEPFAELAARPELNLAVEKNLMLVYRMPYYIFVAKDNHELAEDIERGFNLAIANGNFDRAFFSAPAVRDVIEKANMKDRKIFYIDNPLMTPETPVDREELWFDPRSL